MTFSYAKLVVAETLEGAGLPAPFSHAISIPLKQRGRILSDADASQWYSLVDACCNATHGDQRFVPRVVASIEVMIAALDVLDEIEDGDRSPLGEVMGIPQTIHVSTMLLAFSYQILSDHELSSWNAQIAAKLHNTLAEGAVRASIGQALDLLPPEERSITTDDAFRITQLKSGTLGATACRMGALLGSADIQTLDACYEFGLHFGTMAQIANDIHDSMDRRDKTDLRVGKVTLPIAFASGSPASPTEVVPDIERSDEEALAFSWVVHEAERLRCLRTAERLRELGFASEFLVSLVGD